VQPVANGRKWLTWTGVVMAVSATLVVSSTSVVHGADPTQVCNDQSDPGDGTYGIVNQADIPEGGGTVYLLYDNQSGKNCAVTIGSVAGNTYMDVGLKHHTADDAAGVWNSGTSAEYAGPVYLQAAGICVDFTGAVGTRSTIRSNVNCGA
jgi:hypothetical protein